MELKLENGKYLAKTRGGLESVRGNEELIQRVEMKLRARRGSYALMPEFGSRLHTLASHKPSERQSAAEQFVAEALSDEKGLSVETLSLRTLEDDAIEVRLSLKKADSSFSISALF